MLSCSIIGAFCPLVSTMLQVVMVILFFPVSFSSLAMCSPEHICTVVSLLRKNMIIVIASGLCSL